MFKNRENVVTALLSHFDHFLFADVFRCLIDIPLRCMIFPGSLYIADIPWWSDSTWFLNLLMSQFSREETCANTSIVLCSIIQRAATANSSGLKCGASVLMTRIVSENYMKYLFDKINNTASEIIVGSVIEVLDRLLWGKMPKGFHCFVSLWVEEYGLGGYDSCLNNQTINGSFSKLGVIPQQDRTFIIKNILSHMNVFSSLLKSGINKRFTSSKDTYLKCLNVCILGCIHKSDSSLPHNDLHHCSPLPLTLFFCIPRTTCYLPFYCFAAFNF